MSRTVLMKDGEDKPIPPDPGVKRIPVRIDSKTVIYVAEGDDVEKHRKRYEEHEYDIPGASVLLW